MLPAEVCLLLSCCTPPWHSHQLIFLNFFKNDNVNTKNVGKGSSLFGTDRRVGFSWALTEQPARKWALGSEQLLNKQ